MGNDAICRYAITILGVTKEVLASVPISLVSKKGNEMTRGSVADRLAAEGLKNAAECWGVGRYLDDQIYTTKYLWDRKEELTEDMVGEIRKLMTQYKSVNKVVSANQTISPSPSPTPSVNTRSKVISEAQSKRLWAVAKNELKLTNEDVKAVFAEFNIESTNEITMNQYDIVITKLRDFAANF